MKLRPLSNHVIVKAAAQEEMTKSGIVLPGSAEKERPEKGEIIAIGPGKQLESGQLARMNVKIGDQVVFKKYSPDEVKIDGEEYLILEESDIVAIID